MDRTLVHRTRGFTLFEILVAITIMLVLAGLIFSASRRSIDSAKGTVCISNLRQIHAALLLYEADHGALPLNNLRWEPFQKYFGGTLLLCPLNHNSDRWKDYILNANWHDKLPDEDVGIRRACQETRGAEFPIAFDFNHCDRLLRQPLSADFIFLVRYGGAVNRVPATKLTVGIPSAERPCPLSNPVDNL